jgi:hypothetical protein
MGLIERRVRVVDVYQKQVGLLWTAGLIDVGYGMLLSIKCCNACPCAVNQLVYAQRFLLWVYPQNHGVTKRYALIVTTGDANRLQVGYGITATLLT